jgi:hypothetical protein
MNGWIKLHYKFLKWEWSNDANMVALFLHLLLKANYQGRNWRGQDIKRGELITGLHSLSAETGISLQSLRTCLKRLKSTNEITIKSTNKYSVICIRNYNKYQHEPTSKLTSKLTNNQQTTNKQLTTPKEYNKERKSINSVYTSDFIDFWTKYPKKTGKGAAFSSWKKLSKTEKDKISDALDWQILSEQWLKDSGQFIPNPQTYLNQKRWDDEPTKIRKMKNQVYN